MSKVTSRVLSAVAGLAAVVSGGNALADTSHSTKLIQYLQSSGSGGQCMYFTLIGVNEADPLVPGNPWFAIPLNHPTAKEIFAILSAAKISDKTVSVRTSTTTACGYAAVEYVYMT